MRCVRLVVLSLILAAMGISFAAVVDFSEEADLVTAGKNEEAISRLQAMLVDHPKDPALSFWLGRAFYGQRLYRMAAKSFDVTVKATPNDKESCRWYASALLAAEKIPEAQLAFNAYAQRFPGDFTIYGEMAICRVRAGDYQGARDLFTQLAARDASPATQREVANWLGLLNDLPTLRAQLLPPTYYRSTHFDLYYSLADTEVTTVNEQVEIARKKILQDFGVELTGFRVLLYSKWDSYTRYAHFFVPESREIRSTAFTMPNTLVLWSPSDWPDKEGKAEEFLATLKHEMAHLAIFQQTGGDGIPCWLNEGLACLYGGRGILKAGTIKVPPMTLAELDAAFQSDKLETQQNAYAQAHAMATVLAQKLGREGLGQLLTKLSEGAPLTEAYKQGSGELFTTFLAEWKTRFEAPKEPAPDEEK